MASIHVAAAQNLPLRVQRLVQISHALLEARTSNKVSMTPLMVAAANGAQDSFHTLVGLGANLRAQSGTGMSAVSYAATRGHTSIALSLLGNGEMDIMQELLEQLQRPMSNTEKTNGFKVLAGVTQAIAAEPTDRYSHGRSKSEHLRALGVVSAIDDLLKKVTSEESSWESPAQHLMQAITHLAEEVCSDLVTNGDVLRTLVGIMQKCDEPSTCITVIHTLKAMIKRDPSACFQIVSMNAPLVMMDAMRKHRSEPLLVAAVGCMEASTSRPEVARALYKSGVLSGLARMVGSPHLPPNVSSSLLNTVENVATCLEEARKEAVSLGVVQALLGMLHTERVNRIGRILGLLHTLCLGKEDGADVLRRSPHTISQLVGQQEILEAGCVHSLVKIIDQASCSKPSCNVMCALRVLETLSCAMAMRPNRKFQQLAEKLGAWRCLLKLYSMTSDKDTQAQILCTLSASSVGNPALKQLLLNDPRFELSQVASSMVAMETDHVGTVSRALCYQLYNSRDLQGWLAERGGLPYAPFKARQRSQDRAERARASFEAVVMAKLFTDRDGMSVTVEGIKSLSLLLVEVEEEGEGDLQVLIGSLVCALLRTGDGLGSAFLSLGVARPLVAMLLEPPHDGSLKTSALALCLLSRLPRGTRVVMKYGRRAPYLVPLIQRYSPTYPLSQGFWEDWTQYCKDHPKAAAKQARLTKMTVISSLYSDAKLFANVKVEESPALTDPGEGQEEEEEEPRISCGVPLHQTKGFVMSKSRAAVVKLPSIMQPNV
eukprot:Em0018g1097a